MKGKMMTDTDSQQPVSSDPQFEKEVLLAEFKAHRDEILHWNSIAAQAVTGYLVGLSIIAAIINKTGIGGKEREIIIGLAFISVVLLNILLQFKYVVVVRQKHMAENLQRRINYLCFRDIQQLPDNCRRLDWDSLLGRDRNDKKTSLKFVYWLTKFGVPIVPYFIIFTMWVLYLVNFVCEDCRDMVANVASSSISPWLLINLWLSVAIFTAWHFFVFRKLSHEEQKISLSTQTL